LVHPLSAPAFAENIEPYLADPELRVKTGERARQRILGRFDEPTIAARLERIYLEAIQGPA
jgi:glycosyltransferase involved in cell wall biosynthesis